MTLITCRDAAFAYDGEVVVNGLNFEVQRGDYIVVVGENGGGKSTLVKGLLRLKSPARGEMVFSSRPCGVGYMPQQGASANGKMPASVMEVTLSGHGGLFRSRDVRQKARDNLRRTGAYELRDAAFYELSGGQRQRVLLARALMAARELLILDEPAAGLDPAATRAMYALVSDINREDGMAVIMVSHDVAEALKYAKIVLHLDHEQTFFGSVSDYLLSPSARKLIE